MPLNVRRVHTRLQHEASTLARQDYHILTFTEAHRKTVTYGKRRSISVDGAGCCWPLVDGAGCYWPLVEVAATFHFVCLLGSSPLIELSVKVPIGDQFHLFFFIA